MNKTTYAYQTGPRRIVKTTRITSLSELLHPIVTADTAAPLDDVHVALRRAEDLHEADHDSLGLISRDDYCGAFDEAIEMDLVGTSTILPGDPRWPETLTPLLDRSYPDRGWVRDERPSLELFQRDPLTTTVTEELDEILVNQVLDMGAVFAWSVGARTPDVDPETAQEAVGTIFVERLERSALGLSEDESVVFHHAPGLHTARAIVTAADGSTRRYLSTSAGHPIENAEDAAQARELFRGVIGRRIISMSIDL